MNNNPPNICVICQGEHNCMWKEHPSEPSMYCDPCAELKRQAKGVVTHVIDGLYLGDLIAAKGFDGARLCVHENPEYATTHQGATYHMPYLTKPPNSPLDRTGALASWGMLDKIAEFIETALLRGHKLIVHCKGGVERSPLAIAHYLVNYSDSYDNYTDAYAFLKSIRPVVSKRTFWLPAKM